MPGQKQGKGGQREDKQPQERKLEPATEQAVERAAPAAWPGGPPLPPDDVPLQAMAARLSDTCFQTAQRQAMPIGIRRVSGNQYLQRAANTSLRQLLSVENRGLTLVRRRASRKLRLQTLICTCQYIAVATQVADMAKPETHQLRTIGPQPIPHLGRLHRDSALGGSHAGWFVSIPIALVLLQTLICTCDLAHGADRRHGEASNALAPDSRSLPVPEVAAKRHEETPVPAAPPPDGKTLRPRLLRCRDLDSAPRRGAGESSHLLVSCAWREVPFSGLSAGAGCPFGATNGFLFVAIVPHAVSLLQEYTDITRRCQQKVQPSALTTFACTLLGTEGVE